MSSQKMDRYRLSDHHGYRVQRMPGPWRQNLLTAKRIGKERVKPPATIKFRTGIALPAKRGSSGFARTSARKYTMLKRSARFAMTRILDSGPHCRGSERSASLRCEFSGSVYAAWRRWGLWSDFN